MAFFIDGREVSLEEWNRALNEAQPMSILEEHPNPLARMKERRRREAFTGMIRNLRGAVAADIGCEGGHLAKMIAPHCAKLYCMDIDAAVLDRAKGNLRDFSNIEYIACDAAKIPLPDNTLDICVAAETLEHLPRPEDAMDEMARITKPGGRIYLSVPNEKLLQIAKKSARALGMGKSLGRLSDGLAVGHVRVFDKKMLSDMCAGRVRLETMRYSAPFFLNIFAAGRPVKK